jgi:hypothetical protein
LVRLIGHERTFWILEPAFGCPEEEEVGEAGRAAAFGVEQKARVAGAVEFELAVEFEPA